jgi:hypothetical protein
MRDTFAAGNAGQPLEGTLVERFRNLGMCASRANVTAALAELALDLELSVWAPWRPAHAPTQKQPDGSFR